MKAKFRLLLALGAALASAVAPGFAAKDEKKAPAPAVAHQKPVLRIDSTPLEAHAGVVLSYADVVEPVQQAVVSIYSSRIVRQRIGNPILRQLFPDLPDQRESKEAGLGSGVIVSADGYVLTNAHVVEGADELKVLLSDQREFVGKLIGADPKTDIAVVKIEGEKLPVVTLADSDKLRVGDVVFAVGNPLDVGQTVTMGIVSAKNRIVHILEDVQGYEDYIQTDAAINMGNSGGALIDAKGRLVGVNSAILSPSRGSIGIGFAVPVNLASSIMNSLIETGTVSRGYLGVSGDPVTADIAEQLELPKDTKGIVISEIFAGSAAEKAGLKRLDVILAINGHTISTTDELRLMIAQMAPGSGVKLKVVRDGKERTVDVTLDKFAEKPNELIAGVNVKPLGSEERRRLRIDPSVTGVLITDVADDSPFADQLAPNMVIVEINRTQVADTPTVAAARQLLNNPGRNLLLIYARGRVSYMTLILR